MAMHVPELRIKQLNAALRNLRGACTLLEDAGLDAQILPVARKLLLAEVLGNISIVAVGGQQGAGKTSVMRALYQEDTDIALWLDPNEGRGEKLPILVMEVEGQQQVQGAVRRMACTDSRYELVQQEVGPDDFRKAALDPSAEDLLPVLLVPQRYFKNEHRAWMLLPGYEARDRENEGWQALMRHALIAASGWLIVTDDALLANAQDREIVRDMLSSELSGMQPLLVITRTESLRGDAEALTGLARKAMEVYQVPPHAVEKAVVCIGTGDPSYVAQWLPKLRSGVERLAAAGHGHRQTQLRRLEALIGNDLSAVLQAVRGRAHLHFQGQKDGDGEEALVKECLEAFDDAADTLLDECRKGMEAALRQQTDAAWDVLQGKLVADHEGVWNKLTGLGDTVTQRQLALEKDVRSAWMASSVGQDGVARPIRPFFTTIDTVVRQRLGGPPAAAQTAGNTRSDPDLLRRLGYVNERQEPKDWKEITTNTQHDLRIIFRPEEVTDGADQKLSPDYLGSIKTIPALTLEYARLASLLPVMVGLSAEFEQVPHLDVANAFKEVASQFKEGAEISRTVLASVATVMAVDAADGEIDTVPALLKALGLSAMQTATQAGSAAGSAAGTATAGAAVTAFPVATAVVGVLAVGYLVHAALQQARTHDERVRAAAYRMVMSIHDHHVEHFDAGMRSLMREVRAHLSNRLRARFRLDERLMEKDRVWKAISDVRSLQRDLLDEFGTSGATLPLFNAASV